MIRIRLGAVLLAFVLAFSLVPRSARADVPPDFVRSVDYDVSYENLDAFPDYVFFVYPTTNSGFAYRVEPGKSVTHLMMREGQHESPGTSLYAVKKSDFDNSTYTKNTYPHGDNHEMVQVFRPIPGAVKSNMIVSPPKGHVALDSPQRKLTRVFRVVKIAEGALELTLVKNEMTMKDGSKKEVPFGQELDDSAKNAWRAFAPNVGPASSAQPVDASAPAAPVTPEPPKRGCAVAGRSEIPWGWLLAALVLWGSRRRR